MTRWCAETAPRQMVVRSRVHLRRPAQPVQHLSGRGDSAAGCRSDDRRARSLAETRPGAVFPGILPEHRSRPRNCARENWQRVSSSNGGWPVRWRWKALAGLLCGGGRKRACGIGESTHRKVAVKFSTRCRNAVGWGDKYISPERPGAEAPKRIYTGTLGAERAQFRSAGRVVGALLAGHARGKITRRLRRGLLVRKADQLLEAR